MDIYQFLSESAELSEKDLRSIRNPLGLLSASAGTCSLMFMGREIQVNRETVGPGLDPWDQILVLRYLLGNGTSRPSGVWKAFRDLKDGTVKAEGFRKECERPLATLFETYGTETFRNRVEKLGGRTAAGHVAPLALEVFPLPQVPLLMLVWPGDAEFGADAKILLDETSTSFLDVESLIFLGERLLARLEDAA